MNRELVLRRCIFRVTSTTSFFKENPYREVGKGVGGGVIKRLSEICDCLKPDLVFVQRLNVSGLNH